MPKIKITEKDITGRITDDSASNTVYIPGKAATAFDPVLCESLDKVDAVGLNDGEAKKLAKHLVRLGMKVLVEGIAETATIVPSDSWEKLQDKAVYDVRFLTTGDFPGLDMNAVKCAFKRGDCVALIDHEKDVTTAKDVRDIFDASGVSFEDTTTEKDMGEFAAAFTPWIKVRDNDDFTEETSVPGSFGYLLAYARLVKNGNDGLAVAGSERGIIPELTGVEVAYTNADVEKLQARSKSAEVDLDDTNDNKGIAINPITWVRPFGHIIWGNRTLKNNNGTLEALSFLNIRQTVSTIKKRMYDAARKYTFEQNSEVLWTNFQNQITPTLDAMQSGNVLLGYKFLRLKTDKKARLKARLIVVPVEAVEDFELEVLISDSLDVEE